MFRIHQILLLGLAAGVLHGQVTQLDLHFQSRDVDFSTANATKPFKSGTTFPSVCAVGEMFFKTDGPAGANLYGCTALNSWSLESTSGGGSGAGMVSQLGDFAVTRTSATVLTIGANCSPGNPCQVRFENVVYAVLAASATLTISAGSVPAYVYVTSAGALTCASASDTLVGSGCTVTTGSAFPSDSVPIFTWTATSGTWDALGATDNRAVLSSQVNLPGAGVNVTHAGGKDTFSMDTAFLSVTGNGFWAQLTPASGINLYAAGITNIFSPSVSNPGVRLVPGVRPSGGANLVSGAFNVSNANVLEQTTDTGTTWLSYPSFQGTSPASTHIPTLTNTAYQFGDSKVAITPPTTLATLAFSGDNQIITLPLFVTNAQTGTYQVLAADFAACKTIPVASGTFTITLVASGSQPPSGQCIDIINYGTGVVTAARSGQNINGAAANLTIAAGSASTPVGLHVVSDGTNYVAQTWGAGNGGITCTSCVNTQLALATGASTITTASWFTASNPGANQNNVTIQAGSSDTNATQVFTLNRANATVGMFWTYDSGFSAMRQVLTNGAQISNATTYNTSTLNIESSLNVAGQAIALANGLGINWSGGANLTTTADLGLRRSAVGTLSLDNGSASGVGSALRITGFAQANLPSSSNGTITWCTDCNANCTTGGGSGIFCKRVGGAWLNF